jgi:hypothetical protein
MRALTRHRQHVDAFGICSANKKNSHNVSRAERESAQVLERVYREMLFWEPGRAASLHNYGIFLEDIMGNRSAAEWLYAYGGFEVEPRQVCACLCVCVRGSWRLSLSFSLALALFLARSLARAFSLSLFLSLRRSLSL